MEYRRLGNSDLKISVVGLGTWAMGGEFYGHVDDGESIDAIRTAIDSGINLIDTAPAYGSGHSEEIVGKAIAGRRDDVVIATKCGILKNNGGITKNLKPDSIRTEVEASLRRLQVDVIDLYQMHWPDPTTPVEESAEELEKLRKAGKIRYVGVSNFSPKLMERVHPVTELVSTQPQFSILDRRIEGDVIPYVTERNIGVLSYGTLGGGILTGKFRAPPKLSGDDRRGHFYGFYDADFWQRIQPILRVLEETARDRDVPVSQVAINWSIQQRGITTALVGAKRPEQARSNAAGRGVDALRR